MILGGGAGAETQTSKNYCSQDKAMDIQARGHFFMMILFSFLQEQGGTVRLSKAITPRLKIDKGLELTRQAECRCRLEGSSKSLSGGFLRERAIFLV
jgi:hypothetical protein